MPGRDSTAPVCVPQCVPQCVVGGTATWLCGPWAGLGFGGRHQPQHLQGTRVCYASIVEIVPSIFCMLPHTRTGLRILAPRQNSWPGFPLLANGQGKTNSIDIPIVGITGTNTHHVVDVRLKLPRIGRYFGASISARSISSYV